MDKRNQYYNQVQLLLQLIPYIAEHDCFALKITLIPPATDKNNQITLQIPVPASRRQGQSRHFQGFAR